MNFEKYEKFIIEWRKVKEENDRRTAEKFAECEKWVNSHLLNSGMVWTKHDEILQEQRFLIWTDCGNITHKFLMFADCGIAPLELLPFPEYQR